MARAYDVVATALALDVDRKWLDNVLSHHSVPGIRRGRQGLSRRIPPESLTLLAVLIVLVREMALPTRRALELAEALCVVREGERGRCALPSGLELRLDIDGIQRQLDGRLREIAEIAVPARRGRPPARPPA